MKPAKSNRPPLVRRPFRLVTEEVRERIIAAVRHLPLDTLRPIEVVFQEHRPARGETQNALYWAMLNEIAAQAWIEGRQYSAAVLHEWVKQNMLPEDVPPPDPADVRENYKKWEYGPDGERFLVGSTTMLTVRGFANLITMVEVFGSNLGVEFSARAPA